MATQTIEVPGVPGDLVEKLDERAKEAGTTRAELVLQLLRRELGGDASGVQSRTFAEILKPIHDHTERMGYTEEDLDFLFEQARDEVYRERIARESKSPA